MKLLLRRFLVFILVFVLLLQCTNYPIKIYASEEETEKSEEEILREILDRIGNGTAYINFGDIYKGLVTDSFNLFFTLAGFTADPSRAVDYNYRKMLEKGIEMGLFETDGKGLFVNVDDNPYLNFDDNGNMNISEELLREIRDMLKEQEKESSPYQYLKFTYPHNEHLNVFTNNIGYSANNYGDYSYREPILKHLATIDPSKPVGYYVNTAGAWYYSYIAEFDPLGYMYAYLDNGKIRYLDRELNEVYPLTITELCNVDGTWFRSIVEQFTMDDLKYSLSSHTFKSDGLKTTTGIDYPVGFYYNPRYSPCIMFTDYNSLSIVNNYTNNSYTSGTGMNVFNSYESLLRYLTDKPVAYYSSNYNNGTYQDITVDKDYFNNYSTENIQNIYNTIYNNTQNSTNADEFQKIIDDTLAKELEKMNGTLSDVEDNTSDMLGELRKIYKFLNDDFYKSFKDFKLDTTDYLDDIVDLLRSIKTSLDMLVLVDTTDLLYDIFGDTPILEALTDISSQFTALEMVKTKFPFSIPWDIIRLFGMFAHEPVAPDFHFKIPLNIGKYFEYEFDLHIDLTGKDWQKISDLSRFFLSATFVVFLYRFTYKRMNK